MEKPDKQGYDYILSIPYETDEELDNTIYRDIFAEAESAADARHCFIEADMVSLDDPERRW
jgi:hypothetical protein